MRAALLTIAWFSAQGVALPARDSVQHSLTFPAKQEELERNWFTDGGKLDKEGLVLNRGELDKVGTAWSRLPIPSDNFQVDVTFRAELPDDAGDYVEYDGLAMWYVYEGFKRPGKKIRLFGHKSKYHGLGVFMYFDAGSPMLTALANGGPPNRISREDVMSSEGGLSLYEELLGGRGSNEVKVAVRVEPHLATITIAGQRGRTKVHADFRPGGYLGFTAVTASSKDSPPQIDLPPAVSEMMSGRSSGASVVTLKRVAVTTYTLEQHVRDEPDQGPPTPQKLVQTPTQSSPEPACETGGNVTTMDGLGAEIAALRELAGRHAQQIAGLRREVDAVAAKLAR